jgi:hypothetical protein
MSASYTDFSGSFAEVYDRYLVPMDSCLMGGGLQSV